MGQAKCKFRANRPEGQKGKGRERADGGQKSIPSIHLKSRVPVPNTRKWELISFLQLCPYIFNIFDFTATKVFPH